LDETTTILQLLTQDDFELSYRLT